MLGAAQGSFGDELTARLTSFAALVRDLRQQIKVEAFGLNQSERHTWLGLADGVTFPRLLGIEAPGVVVDCPSGDLASGAQVAALMCGLGRTFDGGYRLWRRRQRSPA